MEPFPSGVWGRDLCLYGNTHLVTHPNSEYSDHNAPMMTATLENYPQEHKTAQVRFWRRTFVYRWVETVAVVSPTYLKCVM